MQIGYYRNYSHDRRELFINREEWDSSRVVAVKKVFEIKGILLDFIACGKEKIQDIYLLSRKIF